MKPLGHNEVRSILAWLWAPHSEQGSTIPEDRTIPPPPRDLLECVTQRDPEALGNLFDHYFDVLFGLAFRLLGNRQAAEDATQDIFLKIHRGAPRLDPARDPAPWLVTIAVNTCRSVHRSGAQKMSTQAVTLDASTDFRSELTDDGPDPAESREKGDREAAVQAALMQLPEGLREIILLRDYQGLGHKEIAEVLGVGHDAVRKRYSRALQQLAEALQNRL